MEPLFRLDKKVAVITGAGSGIGKAIALLFAQQGAETHLLDLNLEDAQSVSAEISKVHLAASTAYSCDVSNADQVLRVMNSVLGKSSQIDILVNNAGIAHIGNIENTSEQDFDRLYAVNVKGVFNCLKAVIPQMLKSGGGAIVNLASIASLVGLQDRFAYSMTKGAVHTMTLSVAADYIKKGIRCNCICPARIHTPFVDGFIQKNYPGKENEMFAKLSASQPIGRMGEPEEVAYLALYLCSDQAKFISGAAYPIDGGVINLR